MFSLALQKKNYVHKFNCINFDRKNVAHLNLNNCGFRNKNE